MIQISDPQGKNQLAWARDVTRALRDLDRRLSSILSQRPRSVEESIPAKAVPQPFQLVVSASTATPPTPMIRVIASTLAGGSATDLGFAAGDDPPYLLTPAEGILQGGITIDESTGAVTSRWLEIVGTLSSDSNTTFYVEIGTVHWAADSSPEGGHWTVTNSRYGPIAAQICRNWYAAAAPFYGVNWS